MLLQQLIIGGLLTGAVYGLIGVGFTLVIGVGKIANFAHGAFVALGMYAAVFAKDRWDLNPYITLFAVVPMFALAGWLVAELFEWRGRKAGQIGELLIGLALLLVINGALEVQFGVSPRTIQGIEFGRITIFGRTILGTEILAATVTLVLALGLYAFVRYTRYGRALRAVASNPAAASLYGIRVPIAQRFAVTVSILLAGIAGIVISPFSVMTPDRGSTYLITAFAVIVVGGIGNTLGAVLAGLGIGLVTSLSSGYLSSYWTTLAPLALIMAILLTRRDLGVGS